MKHLSLVPIFAVAALSGCAVLPNWAAHRGAPQANAAPPLLPAMGQASSAAKLDSATPSQTKAALAPAAASGRMLGRAVVGLGSPAEAGFWVQSALIPSAGKGRVVSASDASVSVDLLPTTGAASLSFSAFRALGFALTDLPEVSIYAQ
jgi:hypothetical protein